jgi:hypothetical protein
MQSKTIIYYSSQFSYVSTKRGYHQVGQRSKNQIYRELCWEISVQFLTNAFYVGNIYLTEVNGLGMKMVKTHICNFLKFF